MSGIGELAAALAAAQAEIKDPGRSKSGQVKGKRDYRYVPLDGLLQTVRPVLSRHGLALSQPIDVVDGRVGVRTLLLHTSGQSLAGWMPLMNEGGNDQDRGSSITYTRRYSLESLIGVAATEDDDAAQASEPRREERRPDPPAEVRREPAPVPQVVDALVAAGWPASSVIAQVRDYAAWAGADHDPWSTAPDVQAKLPDWMASRGADRLAWQAWHTEIATVLGRLATLDQLGEWLATLTPPRRHPQRMSRDDRGKLLAFLRDAGGLDKLRAWREAA